MQIVLLEIIGGDHRRIEREHGILHADADDADGCVRQFRLSEFMREDALPILLAVEFLRRLLLLSKARSKLRINRLCRVLAQDGRVETPRRLYCLLRLLGFLPTDVGRTAARRKDGSSEEDSKSLCPPHAGCPTSSMKYGMHIGRPVRGSLRISASMPKTLRNISL